MSKVEDVLKVTLTNKCRIENVLKVSLPIKAELRIGEQFPCYTVEKLKNKVHC